MKGNKALFIILLLLAISIHIDLSVSQSEEVQYFFTDDPCNKDVFSFSMLSPNINPAMNAWAALMQAEFPKGCIGVDVHLSLDWLSYTSRTINYNVSETPNKRVPLFNDGGYDLGFVGHSGIITPDLMTSFHSEFTLDVGSNWYNYQNATMDALLEAYSVDTNFDTRDVIAKTIQAFLYQDQPSIPIVEDANLYAFNENLLGFGGEEALVFSIYGAQDTYKLLGHADTTKSVVYAHPYTVSEYSPWSPGNSAISNIYQNAIFQGLYQQAGLDLHLEPLIAEGAPYISVDGLTFNVTLRDNVTFANGNYVRAQDVYDSFLRVFDPRYGSSEIGGYLTRFGDPLADPSADNYRSVDQIVRITTPSSGTPGTANYDAGELSFTFIEPYLAADLYLIFPIVDSTIWGSWDSPLISYDTNGYIANNYDGPIGLSGTGPFIYDLIDGTSGNIMLKRNEDYWNGPVQAAYLDFQFYGEKAATLQDLEAGVVDIMDATFKPSLAELADLIGVSYQLLPSYGYQEMFPNMLHHVFGTGLETPLGQNDPSRAAEAARYVRQAMSHLVPRDVIVEAIIEGLGQPGVTPWILGWPHRDNSLLPYEYSISKAKELLFKAGYDTWDFVNSTDTDTLLSKSTTTSNQTGDTSSVIPFVIKYPIFMTLSLIPLILLDRKIKQYRW